MAHLQTTKEIEMAIVNLEQKLTKDWEEISESISENSLTNPIEHMKSYISHIVSSPYFQKIAVEVGISILAAYIHKLIFANKKHSFLAKVMVAGIEIMIAKELKNKILNDYVTV